MRILLVVMLVVAASAAPARADVCWYPPVDGDVEDPYREPPCPYCAGNRGIEYRTSPDSPVRAVATGIVTYAGVVAGVRYVVVRHGDGIRATYGHLAGTHLDVGDRVASRGVIGRATGRLYFGLRRGDRPVDPTPHLGELAGVPRLVPVGGRPGNRVEPVLRCERSVTRSGILAAGGSTWIARLRRTVATTRPRPVGHLRSLRRRSAGHNRKGDLRWPSSRCGRCSRPEFTSATRPDAGTPR